MTDAPPLRFRWDGESMVPASQYWSRRADQTYVVGEFYDLIEHHDRSMNSHRHFFAAINEAWKNLPDELLDEYPTPEHLRKKALIKKGHTLRFQG